MKIKEIVYKSKEEDMTIDDDDEPRPLSPRNITNLCVQTHTNQIRVYNVAVKFIERYLKPKILYFLEEAGKWGRDERVRGFAREMKYATGHRRDGRSATRTSL